MEKIIRSFKVDFNLDWTYGVELSKLKEDINELEKLGVTDIEIQSEDDFGGSTVSVRAFINRLETDEEFNERIYKTKNIKDAIEKRELKQLAKLKLKYKT